MIVGLTGPTGAGKSTVARAAERLGFFVVDCDAAAREESRNPDMLRLLSERFGEHIIKNGLLDRAALATAAFSSRENTEAMNGIMLPFIVKSIEKSIAGQKNVLLDAPTLFESGLCNRCDAVLGIIAPANIRKARIIKRDGLTETAADIRLSAAQSDEFFIDRCDKVIVNDGSETELFEKATAFLSEYIN